MGESVDVIAVVGRVSELSQVTARNDHKQLEKREIFLVDESLTGINLTLWGEQAKEFDASKAGQIIAVKGSFLKEFNGGYSLSISSGSIIKFNPDHPATEKLQEWFREERTLSIKSLSSPAADSIETYERDIRLIGGYFSQSGS
uniref:Replication protein A OB domain-containing protein n=1 Tax=Ditylenchus dipsaci TaxID=166011 RepID=A0A915E2E3_9BILA